MATRRAIIERGDVTVDAETGVVLPVPRPQRVVGRASSEAVVAPGYPAPKPRGRPFLGRGAPHLGGVRVDGSGA